MHCWFRRIILAALALPFAVVTLMVISDLVAPASRPFLRVASMQAVEHDNCLWIFMEVDEVTHRGKLSSPEYLWVRHAIFVIAVDANGVQERHCLSPQIINTHFVHVQASGIGAQPCLLLRPNGPVWVWEDGAFRSALPGEADTLLEEFTRSQGDSGRLTDEALAEFGKATGWAVVAREGPFYSGRFDAIEGQLEVTATNDDSGHQRLVVRGKGPPSWECVLLDTSEMTAGDSQRR